MCKINVIQKKGSLHEELDLLNQDRVLQKRKGELYFIGLLDGVSRNDITIIGLEKILEDLADYMLEKFSRILSSEEAEIQREIQERIGRRVQLLTNTYDVKDKIFTSTIMLVCIDKANKKMISIHLGDGMIVKENNDFEIHSYPFNGREKNSTYLSLEDGSLEKIKIRKSNIEELKEVALVSDGVYNIPILKKEVRNIIQKIKENGNISTSRSDDQSIISIEL